MPSRVHGAGSLNAAIAARWRTLRKQAREDAASPPGPVRPPPPTLSHFAAQRVPIRLECEACWRKVDDDAVVWMRVFGDVTMAEIERRASCSACGEREMIDARPLYERRGGA